MDELYGVYGEIERLFDGAPPKTGRDIALAMAKQFGGGPVYFLSHRRLTMPERDKRICREFRGDNLADLARKYQLSFGRIRDIVAEGQAGGKGKRGGGEQQRSLFEI